MATTITADNVGLRSGARIAAEEAWRLTRTLRGGTAAMRKAGQLYTPMTKREERRPEDYAKRLKLTTLFPMYDTTLRKIASLPFQKAPTVKGDMPPSIVKLIGNADRDGTTLATFMRRIYTDAIDHGIGLFLVDNVPTVNPDGTLMRVDVAEKIDARPYFRRLIPDNVLRIEFTEALGIATPTLLTFESPYWTTNSVGQEILGRRIEVWTSAEVQWWVDDGVGKFRMERSKLNEIGRIPLFPVYTNRTGQFEGAPALEDLAHLNVQHWNSLSMQNAAVNFARFPILSLLGISTDPAQPKQETGPGATIATDNESARFEYVEVAGTSLAAGETEIANIEKRGEALGMQPLMAVSGPTTATGEVIADTNEKSEAQSWIEAMEWAVWHGFEVVAEIAGETLPEDGDWSLYRDSSLVAGKATDVPAIFNALDKGVVTRVTALRELVLRGVVATVEDPDAEMEALQLEQDQQQQSQLDAVQKQIEAERARAAASGADPNAQPAVGAPTVPA